MTPHELHHLLRDELAQRREEDCETAALEAVWADLREQPPEQVAERLEALWTLLEALPAGREADEPSTLEGIRALCPEGPDRLAVDRDTLPDRMLGALLGRIAGCQLGKPVEGWSKADIDAYLAACGESELRDYFPYLDPAPTGLPRTIRWPHCCRGRIARAERDDDQDYTLLGLLLAGRHGREVTSDQVADAWLSLLPYHQTYTAERVAYRNLIDGRRPPASATYRNPYREWIGAQIRCDGWAYVAAGDLPLAAELAFRDAAVSHVKNGIYGEVYFAAVIAAAFAVGDYRQAIELGLTQIPARCRLAECVRNVLAWHQTEPTWRDCWERINLDYGHYHGVHTINNAALVLLGLLYGEGDFAATVGIAVQGGWDTDCNGATAGSVLGAVLGARALPPHLVEPLDDTMMSALFGHGENRISALAAGAVETWERLRA